MTSPDAHSKPRKRRIAGLAAAAAIAFTAFVAGAAPPERLSVAQWAERHRVVSAESGSSEPGRWSNALAPYLVEIMDVLSPAHPAREVVLIKSHQVGGTECGVNLVGYLVDREPCGILIVLPSIDEGFKYNRYKLQPTIDETPVLKSKIRTVVSRDEQASTITSKKFRGGFLQLTGANSSKGLKMISVRVLVLEEVTEYPHDVDGQGDPVALARDRTTAWSGREKIFWCSTPGIEGACRITTKWEASDQRRFHVPCPECGTMQPLEFDRFVMNEAEPDKSHSVCVNGCVIEHRHKAAMMAAGRWVAAFPDQGRAPGFHIHALYSPFLSWGDIVRRWLEAKGFHEKEKHFAQQIRGAAFAEKGDAPDHAKLMERREPYPMRRLPPGVLFLTGAADAQGNRIEWDVYGWAVGLTCWLIDSGVIPGDPSTLEPWAELDRIVDRRYEDAWGKPWQIDAFGVDSGYLSTHVYEFVRRRGPGGRTLALDGRPGYHLPPLGAGQPRSYDFAGRRDRAVELYPVGTYKMKSEHYGALRKTIAGPIEGEFPIGYAHFPEGVGETFFQQQTSEYLHRGTTRTGAPFLEWRRIAGRANERLDIAVYARALAHYLSDHMTAAAWQDLAARRGAPPEAVQGDLARLWSPGLASQTVAPAGPVAGASENAPAAAPERGAEVAASRSIGPAPARSLGGTGRRLN